MATAGDGADLLGIRQPLKKTTPCADDLLGGATYRRLVAVGDSSGVDAEAQPKQHSSQTARSSRRADRPQVSVTERRSDARFGRHPSSTTVVNDCSLV